MSGFPINPNVEPLLIFSCHRLLLKIDNWAWLTLRGPGWFSGFYFRCFYLPLFTLNSLRQAIPATAYPNDSEGLRRLLNDMLVAAKSEDPSKLRSMIQQTEIPNYQSWFTSNFGQEKGESWAELYGRWLEKERMGQSPFRTLWRATLLFPRRLSKPFGNGDTSLGNSTAKRLNCRRQLTLSSY